MQTEQNGRDKRDWSVGGRAWRRAGWAALLLAALVWGAGGARAAAEAADEELVTFTVEGLPGPTDMSVPGMAERAVVRAFLRRYPQYRIEPFLMPAIGHSAMDSGPLMGIAAGVPPNAVRMYFRMSSTYIEHGFLEPLEELLARVQSDDPGLREADEEGRWLTQPPPAEVAYWRDQILARVPRPVWPVIYREAGAAKRGLSSGKHIWAMPTRVTVKALVYRKDIFQEAGLDPERPPQTWDEVLAYARAIRARTNRHGIFIPAGELISWGFYDYLIADGGRFVEQVAPGRWRAAFHSPEIAEAIYFLCRLANESYEVDGQTYTGAALLTATVEGRQLFKQGQVGMTTTSLDLDRMTDINPETTGLAPAPRSPKGNRGSELNALMYGVFSQITPAQRLAVMRYIWFITGEEAQALRTEIFVNNGFGHFVNPDLLERFGYHDVLRRVPPAWRETITAAMESGVPEPYGQNTQFIYESVSAPINWALRQPLLALPKAVALERIREQLAEAAWRVDRFMLGELSASEWRRRRWIGGATLAVIMTLFALCLVFVWKAFSAQERLLGDRPHLWRFRVAYCMIAPALLVVVFWQYLPKLLGMPLALFNYELVLPSTFVGIDNFATVLYDARFWRSLWNTFYYAALVVGLGFWPPILVAVLLDEVPTDFFKYFFRTIFYLPMIVSGVIMIFLWLQLFNPAETGYLNQALLSLNRLGPVGATLVRLLGLGLWFSFIGVLLAVVFHLRELTWPVRGAVLVFALALLGATLWPLVKAWRGPTALVIDALHLEASQVRGFNGVRGLLAGLIGRFDLKPLGWVQDPGLAMLCVVIPGVWATSGPGCIIYLAALKTVPSDLVEAATMDGASLLQKVSYITLPRIKFLILIQLVGAVVGAMQGGTNFILAMTGGGPDGATRILGMDIFQRSFMELNYGIGAAMAWILGALVIGLTSIQLRRVSKTEFANKQ
ncbi:MAG: extracellular solute-binding protein [Candidatus Marinimicrobia bacterium]|nr:extracellular solute-binding protein [Candidatus Neomarinimicrobiota bacterium]